MPNEKCATAYEIELKHGNMKIQVIERASGSCFGLHHFNACSLQYSDSKVNFGQEIVILERGSDTYLSDNFDGTV